MSNPSLGGLPEVGLECRDDQFHSWVRTGDEDILGPDDRARWPGAYYYRVYVCRKDCGARKVCKYDRYWRRLPEYSKLEYTDRGYLVKGGVDQDALAALRRAEFEARHPKAKRGHLRSA